MYTCYKSKCFLHRLSAILCGVCATFALPPFFIFPLFIIGFSGFFILLDKCSSKKSAFFTGWLFGFGHFVTGLYWISNSLLVDADKFAWLIPFAVSLIPAVLSIYVGIVAIITHSLNISRWWCKVLVFSCIWVLSEVLRAHLFTGFPWNLIGYIWAFSLPMMQIASIIGIYGLSFIAVISATIPVVLLKREWKPFIIIIAVVISVYTYGVVVIPNDFNYTKTLVRIIQPNIPQSLKWNPKLALKHFEKHLNLTKRKTGNKPDVIIWPESSLPFLLEDEPVMRKIMSDAIPDGSYLMTGTIRRDGEKVWNSMQAIDSEGNIVATYDKYKLVPFGEFIPFRSILPFIEKITTGGIDFSKGDGNKTLKIGNIPSVSTLICYEGIFSGYTSDRNNPPKWLLNITNDGWFGDSTGPYQHFHMTRFRAVEEGVPLIRAANTGISAVIDSYGRVLSESNLGEEGILEYYIPDSKKIATLYSRFREIIPLILMFLILISSLYISRR